MIQSQQFIKFLFVGLLNTSIAYCVFHIFFNFFNFHYNSSATIGYFIGILNSYIWNKYWTFKSKKTIKAELTKFIIVYLFSYTLNIVTLTVFVEIINIIPEIGEIVGIGFATVISFFGMKYYSFKQ